MFGWFKKKPVHVGVMLGKKAAKYDKRTLRFATYKKALAPAPAVFDFSNRLKNLGMLGNDTLGDCTCAGIYHLIQSWCDYNGIDYVPTTDKAIALYEAACGYNPADPSTDDGGVLLDLLKYWKANPVDGHSIDAYVSVNVHDEAEIQQALYYFGGLYVGVQLPISAQTQDIWDVPLLGTHGDGEPGSWGGHCIANILAYDSKYVYTITWGAVKKMTWKFFETYCDEAYCVLSPDWYGAEKTAPTGFDSATLSVDIAMLEDTSNG